MMERSVVDAGAIVRGIEAKCGLLTDAKLLAKVTRVSAVHIAEDYVREAGGSRREVARDRDRVARPRRIEFDEHWTSSAEFGLEFPESHLDEFTAAKGN
jgi:hypothetical protein